MDFNTTSEAIKYEIKLLKRLRYKLKNQLRKSL